MNRAKAIDGALKNPVQLAIGAAIVLGVVYFLIRKTASDAAKAAGGIVSGNNMVTRNQTDFSGNKVDAYEGKGLAGTLGAVVNSATGGATASVGSKVGGFLSSVFGKEDTSPSVFYTVLFPDGTKHAVGNTWVDKNGYFTYPQGSTVRYKLGILGTQRVATKAA